MYEKILGGDAWALDSPSSIVPTQSLFAGKASATSIYRPTVESYPLGAARLANKGIAASFHVKIPGKCVSQ